MEITIAKQKVLFSQVTVPDLNYGQLKRWQGYEKLNYKLSINTNEFLEKISIVFNEFRQDEIDDDDTCEIAILDTFKAINHPNLIELYKSHTKVLEGLILFLNADILHCLLTNNTLNKKLANYSIQSLDSITINTELTYLQGICFLRKK